MNYILQVIGFYGSCTKTLMFHHKSASISTHIIVNKTSWAPSWTVVTYYSCFH